MKPDYKNWIPKGMIYGLSAGTGVLAAAFAGSLVLLKNATTPVRIVVSTVLGLGAIACGKFTQWSIMAYRQFSYNGKRQLSKQIIEGTAEYVNLPEGGKGLDVGCGSGALTIACAKRNPKSSFIGIDRWGKEYASFSKTLIPNFCWRIPINITIPIFRIVCTWSSTANINRLKFPLLHFF